MFGKHFGGGAGLLFSPGREAYRLKEMIRENRGYRIYGSLKVVLFNNEVTFKSFRELCSRCIPAFLSEARPGAWGSFDIESVSRQLNIRLVYQVDFSYANAGKVDFFVLRIFEVSTKSFRITINQKNSPSSIPLVLSTTPGQESAIWSKTAEV